MKFSILVATYNHEQFILSTISTCLNQNYDDYEVIVSDDCSTDETQKIIDSWIDKFEGQSKFPILLECHHLYAHECPLHHDVIAR